MGLILTAKASDNFIRADEFPLSGNWGSGIFHSTSGDPIALEIVSNRVQAHVDIGYPSPDYFGREWRTDSGWTNDQYSSITFGSWTEENDMMIGAAQVRVSVTGSLITYYQGAMVFDYLNGYSYSLSGQNSVSSVSFGYSVASQPSPGDVLTVAAVGTRVYLLYNDVVVMTGTDSSVTSGVPGIMLSVPSAGDIKLSGWEGGAVTATYTRCAVSSFFG